MNQVDRETPVYCIQNGTWTVLYVMLVAPSQSLAIEALPNGRSKQGSQLDCIGRSRLSSANPKPEALQDLMCPTLLDPPSAEVCLRLDRSKKTP
jgi:hypothetical protein